MAVTVALVAVLVLALLRCVALAGAARHRRSRSGAVPEPRVRTDEAVRWQFGCGGGDWCDAPATHGIFFAGTDTLYERYCATHLRPAFLELAQAYPKWELSVRQLDESMTPFARSAA